MGRRRAFGTVCQHKVGGKIRPGWYIRFTWDGRRYMRYGGTTRKIAGQKLARMQALLEQGKTIGEVLADTCGDLHGSRMTFRDALDRYMTHAKGEKRPTTHRADLSRGRIIGKAEWTGKYLSAITREDVARWADARREKARGSTLNRDLSLISQVFEWAIQRGHVDANPVDKVKRFPEEGKDRGVYLEPKEAIAFLEVCEPEFRPLAATAMMGGMRRGELLSLRWRDVDFDRRMITVRVDSAKTKRARAVPMAPDLERELRDMRETRKVVAAGSLFTLHNGQPLTVGHLRGMFERAKAACKDKIPEDKRERLRFHDLRHTCGSLLVQSGVSLFNVGRILGHSSAQTTLRYAHYSPDAAQPEVDRFRLTPKDEDQAAAEGA